MSDFSVPRFPNVDFGQAKQVAEGFLRQNGYLPSAGLPTRLPINVENLAAKAGHPVSAIEGLQSEFDMRGLVYFNPAASRLEIIVDAYHYDAQPFSSQFTIAEELAHIILHRTLFEQIRSIDERIDMNDAISESTHRFLEMTAKRVGSELLLPDIHFRPYVKQWCSDHIEKIRDERPIDKNDLLLFLRVELGRRLGLSEQIVNRALTRPNPIPVVDEVIEAFKITFISSRP